MEKTASGGIGFCNLLCLVFIVLKLTDVKPVGDWSWWWVLSPIWIPIAIVIVIALLGAMYVVSISRRR